MTETPTATGSLTPSPTGTPTLLTVTPTPTSRLTSTPTPTPTFDPCQEGIDNGGFEFAGDWTFGGAYPADYTSFEHHMGLRAARLGIAPPAAPFYSHSTVYQSVSIPLNAESVTLRFWWKRFTEGTAMGRMSHPALAEGTTLSTLGYDEDLQEVLLLDDRLRNVLEILWRGRSNDGVWVEETFDLSGWRGYTVELYFNAYNDDAADRTWMYVDDVSVEVCLPSGLKQELRPSPEGSLSRLNGEPARGPGLH
jgi:hypothetical protein